MYFTTKKRSRTVSCGNLPTYSAAADCHGVFKTFRSEPLLNYNSNEKDLLLIKAAVKEIKNDFSSSTKKERFKEPLYEVATLLKQDSLSARCEVAARILMAELYIHLSLEYVYLSQKRNARNLKIEAVKCLELAQQIIDTSPLLNRQDEKFISDCNTFNVCNTSAAMEAIIREYYLDTLQKGPLVIPTYADEPTVLSQKFEPMV